MVIGDLDQGSTSNSFIFILYYVIDLLQLSEQNKRLTNCCLLFIIKNT